MVIMMAAMLFISCDSDTKKPEVKTYTVTFVTGDGASAVKAQTVEEGKTAANPAAPAKDDFVFERWSPVKDGKTAFDFKTPITEDITLYAVWREKSSFTVTFNLCGGSGDIPVKTVKEGGVVEKPASVPVKPGYEFVRWSLRENGTDEFKFSEQITADTTLYAVWRLGTYAVGQTGPAGGLIFYVNANAQTDGWTYLEAAPADLENKYTWGISGSFETETGVGKGKSNTEKLKNAGLENFPAAEACVSYSEGGCSDWFLPSCDEFKLMYENLHKNGQGNFRTGSDGKYHTSSEKPDSKEYRFSFPDEGMGSGERSKNIYVRPVRSF